jgi:hypothetical protein
MPVSPDDTNLTPIRQETNRFGLAEVRNLAGEKRGKRGILHIYMRTLVIKRGVGERQGERQGELPSNNYDREIV